MHFQALHFQPYRVPMMLRGRGCFGFAHKSTFCTLSTEVCVDLSRLLMELPTGCAEGVTFTQQRLHLLSAFGQPLYTLFHHSHRRVQRLAHIHTNARERSAVRHRGERGEGRGERRERRERRGGRGGTVSGGTVSGGTVSGGSGCISDSPKWYKMVCVS
eukprot:GHVS01106636.1.p1 GENE.GHVS01106636.1~~GHVS01106636.1.p1  ORF type:complete len:159 (+),score=30.76 GHVS01106636.1:404-880(+)